MAVLHDYRCLAHGNFEARTAQCPHGCGAGMVEKVFLKPVGVTSARTQGIDRNLNQLALDFGMSNMSNQGGRSVKQAAGQSEEQARALQEMLAPRWGGLQSSSKDDASAIPQALAAARAQPDNALAPVKDFLTSPKPQVVGSFGSAADIPKGCPRRRRENSQGTPGTRHVLARGDRALHGHCR